MKNVCLDVYKRQVQVWDCAAQYRPTGSPMGWLLAVCRNLCLMRLRREERHAALSEEEWDAIPAQECGLDADERALLQGALANLSDEEMCIRDRNTAPSSGISRKSIQRRKTLLPQPEPPMMTIRSPFSTVRSTSFRTCNEPKALDNFSTRIMLTSSTSCSFSTQTVCPQGQMRHS